jgi:hypothetical protein
MRRVLVVGLLWAVSVALFAGCSNSSTTSEGPTQKPVQRLKKPEGVKP